MKKICITITGSVTVIADDDTTVEKIVEQLGIVGGYGGIGIGEGFTLERADIESSNVESVNEA